MRWVLAFLALAAWQLFRWLLGHAEGPPFQGISRGELALICLLILWFIGGRLNRSH
jgi:hypothetical protein